MDDKPSRTNAGTTCRVVTYSGDGTTHIVTHIGNRQRIEIHRRDANGERAIAVRERSGF